MGVHPVSELVTGLVDLSPSGYIKIDHDGRTSVPGLFSAGDVTDSELKQVITATQAAFRDVTPMPHNGCRPPKRRRV